MSHTFQTMCTCFQVAMDRATTSSSSTTTKSGARNEKEVTAYFVKHSYRYRVQSAPPFEPEQKQRNQRIMSGRRLPPMNFPSTSSEDARPPIFKQNVPNADQIRQILEQRISQAMSGPHKEIPNPRRKSSLLRSSAIGSEEMRLVPLDRDELSMLRSINRSHNSTSREVVPVDLAKHEYEDKSSEDEEIGVRNRRKMSMVRQDELEETNTEVGRKNSGIRNLEDRLTGYRHEKMRSSTRSGDLPDKEQITGLVYDMDFDCYYNPTTDTYYRLKSMSKSEET